jgi:hypothetical protein
MLPDISCSIVAFLHYFIIPERHPANPLPAFSVPRSGYNRNP